MPLTLIEPRRLYRQVADQIRALIERGEYPAGSRLPTERELAVKLGVSRPTVREALIALEVDGRVKIRVGSGIYVLPPVASIRDPLPPAPMAGPFEILEARALIEGAVAEAAAKAARRSDVATLDGILALMRDTAHPGADSIAVDRSFHVAVAAILGNDAVTEIVGNLFDQRINPYFQQLARYFETANSWEAALREHAAICDAIASGDGRAAATAMRAHLAASQARFSESFGSSPSVTPVTANTKSNRPKPGASSRPVESDRRLAVEKRTRRKSV